MLFSAISARKLHDCIVAVFADYSLCIRIRVQLLVVSFARLLILCTDDLLSDPLQHPQRGYADAEIKIPRC